MYAELYPSFKIHSLFQDMEKVKQINEDGIENFVERETALGRILKFHFRTLWFYGIKPNCSYSSDKNFSVSSSQCSFRCGSRLSCRNILFLIFAHCYVIHMIANTFCYLSRSGALSVIISNVVSTVKYLSGVVALVHFIKNYSSIMLFLSDAEHLTNTMSQTLPSSLKWFTRVSIIAGWLYFIISIAFTVVFGIADDVPSYYDMYLYNFQPPSGFIGNAIPILDFAFYLYVSSVNTMLQIFFLCCCYFLCSVINIFTSYVSRRNVTMPSISKRHTKLLLLVKKLDDIYNKVLFVWYCDMTVTLMFSIPNIVKAYVHNELHTMADVVFDVAVTISMFFCISLLASNVEVITEKLDIAIHIWMQYADNSSMRYEEGSILITKFSSRKLYLTGWRTFIINRGYMLTLLSGIVTYIVIVIQFLP